MLRTTSGLSRPVLKWVSQVTASLGATLCATLIWSAVPHPGVQSVPGPAVTSGGKFAARAMESVAYDGLDMMPLPSVAPVPVRFTLAPAEAFTAAPVRPAPGGDVAPASPRTVRLARPLPRAEAHRIAPAPHAVPVSAPVAAAPGPEARTDEGFLHALLPSVLPRVLPAIVSTARGAWSMTASAGDTLVSHVVPQLP